MDVLNLEFMYMLLRVCNLIKICFCYLSSNINNQKSFLKYVAIYRGWKLHILFCRLRNEKKRKYGLKVIVKKNEITFLLILFYKPEFKSKICLYSSFYEKNIYQVAAKVIAVFAVIFKLFKVQLLLQQPNSCNFISCICYTSMQLIKILSIYCLKRK